jgi:hypothetical protein
VLFNDDRIIAKARLHIAPLHPRTTMPRREDVNDICPTVLL